MPDNPTQHHRTRSTLLLPLFGTADTQEQGEVEAKEGRPPGPTTTRRPIEGEGLRRRDGSGEREIVDDYGQ